MGACLSLDVRKAYELEMKRLDLNRQAASLMNKMNSRKSNKSRITPKAMDNAHFTVLQSELENYY